MKNCFRKQLFKTKNMRNTTDGLTCSMQTTRHSTVLFLKGLSWKLKKKTSRIAKLTAKKRISEPYVSIAFDCEYVK